MRILSLKKCKRIAGLSFAPDGGRLAIATSEVVDHVGSVVWLDIQSGVPARAIQVEAERCALSPRHDRLAVSYSQYARPRGAGQVRWTDLHIDRGNGAWNDLPDVPYPEIFTLRFTPDGKRLAIGCSHQRSIHQPWTHAVHVAPLGSGKPSTLEMDELVGEMTFSADGKWMTVCGGPEGDNRIRVFTFPKGVLKTEYTPKATRTRRLVFAPNCPELIALCGKQALRFQAGNPEPLAVLDGHTATVTDAAYTPDGRHLITVGNDSTARVWDAGTGAALKTLAWPVGKLSTVAVAPDGLTCAAGGEKGRVVVWDVDE